MPEVGEELLDLEEEWGGLRPLEKEKRGFLDPGLMDPATGGAAGLWGSSGSNGFAFLWLP